MALSEPVPKKFTFKEGDTKILWYPTVRTQRDVSHVCLTDSMRFLLLNHQCYSLKKI